MILGALLLQANGLLAPRSARMPSMILAFVFGASFVWVEGLPPLNNIPAYYFGAITMIASGLAPEPRNVVTLALAVGLGLVFGWITVFGRKRLGMLQADLREERG